MAKQKKKGDASKRSIRKERQSWREFQFREKARRNTERLKRERQKEEEAFEKLVYDMTGLMLVLSGVMVVSYVLFFQW